MSPWHEQFIGLPFKDGGRDSSGIDCYGLVYLIYNKVLEINLPSYSEYTSCTDSQNVNLVVEKNKGEWKKIYSNIEKIKPFDVVLLKLKGLPVHVGLMVDEIHFIHVLKGRNVVLERLTHPLWATKVEGFYRWN